MARFMIMKGCFPCRSCRDSGSVLILTLWTLCLLAIFAVYMGYAARAKLDEVDRLNQYSMLRHIAKAGISDAKSLLQAIYYVPDNGSNTITTSVADYGALASMTTKVGDGVALVAIGDEEGKLNLNTAPRDVLARLFEIVGQASEGQAVALADAVIDWRDPDSSPQPSGAEEDYYASLPKPYHCKNKPLNSTDELLLVRGFAGKIYDDVLPYVTVCGNGRVNINSATPQVLLAIGLEAPLVDKIMRYLAGPDGVRYAINDKDDMTFWGLDGDSFGPPTPGHSPLSPVVFSNEEDEAMVKLANAGLLGCTSWHFHVQSDAIRGHHPGVFRILATFEVVPGQTDGHDVNLVGWRTYP